MSIKPILFNTEMVKAILDGRKTMTRRVAKPQPPADSTVSKIGKAYGWSRGKDSQPKYLMKQPYQPGDVLWVRETWGIQSAHRFECDAKITYKAGGDLQKVQFSNWDDYDRFIWNKHIGDGKWYLSIHMPREASRIFLRVTGVRVERLKDITEEDATAEGICGFFLGMGETGYSANPEAKTFYDGPVGAFANLWSSTINPADRDHYGWSANPWVWVIEFERCEKPKEWGNV